MDMKDGFRVWGLGHSWASACVWFQCRTICQDSVLHCAPSDLRMGCAVGWFYTAGLTGHHGCTAMGMDRSSATISSFAQHKGAVPSILYIGTILH